MATRRAFKCVAKGLHDSFISRNNDVAGYWGIGRLCLFSQNQKQEIVVIDLIESSISPKTREFDWLVSGFCKRLRLQMVKKGMPQKWVNSAKIIIDFNPSERPKKYPVPLTWGNLFQLLVILTDDKDQKYAYRSYGHCSPHDAHRERKSIGLERY